MDKKTKVLLLVLFIGILFSIFLTFKRAFIDQDFEIINYNQETLYE